MLGFHEIRNAYGAFHICEIRLRRAFTKKRFMGLEIRCLRWLFYIGVRIGRGVFNWRDIKNLEKCILKAGSVTATFSAFGM